MEIIQNSSSHLHTPAISFGEEQTQTLQKNISSRPDQTNQSAPDILFENLKQRILFFSPAAEHRAEQAEHELLLRDRQQLLQQGERLPPADRDLQAGEPSPAPARGPQQHQPGHGGPGPLR